MSPEYRKDLLENMDFAEVIDLVVKMHEYAEEVLEDKVRNSDFAEAREVCRLVSGSYPKNPDF